MISISGLQFNEQNNGKRFVKLLSKTHVDQTTGYIFKNGLNTYSNDLYRQPHK